MSAAAAATIGYHEDLLGAYAEHCSALGLTRSGRDERLIAGCGFLTRFPDLSAWMARPLPVRLADLDRAPLAWSLIAFAAFTGKVRVDFDLLVAKHVGRSFGPAIVALFPTMWPCCARRRAGCSGPSRGPLLCWATASRSWSRLPAAAHAH